MNIQELVSEVLKEIAQGINQAQGQSADALPITVPKYVAPHKGGGTYDQTTRRQVNLVSFALEFSVESAESATQGSGKSGGIKFSVLNADIGKNAGEAKSSKSSHTQSVSFNIPVLWPSHDGSEHPPIREKVNLSNLQQSKKESVI